MKKIILPLFIVFAIQLFAQVGTGNVGINTVTPEKTLDVNGDFRSSKTDSSTNIQYLLETNSILYPGSNLAGVFNPTDGTGSLFMQNKNISSFSTATSDGSSGFGSMRMPGFNIAMLTSSSGNANSSISADPNGFSMISQDTSTGSTSFTVPNNIYVGPYFMYMDNTGTITGNYFFPRNYGLRGQVLVTHGKPSAAGNGGLENDLVWRDVADLIVLKSPGGNCFKITVSDTGILSTTPDPDCMVDPFNPTTYSTTSRMAAGNTNTSADPNKMIEEQKKQIEEMQKQMKEIKSKLIQKNTKNTK